MIPPTTIELKLHSDNLADFGEDLHKLNGASKALLRTTVVVVGLIALTMFLPPAFAGII